MLWDLIQQSQLASQQDDVSSLEARVASLERQLNITNQILREVVKRVEIQTGEDLDRDGRVG